MAHRPSKPVMAPALPPPTELEEALGRQISAQLQQLCVQLKQRNLDNAVLMAQQAARGRGPLVDYFCELGRRYDELVQEPEKPKLQLVKGKSA